MNVKRLTVAAALAAIAGTAGIATLTGSKPKNPHPRETGVCQYTLPDGSVHSVKLDDAEPGACRRAAAERKP